MTLQEAFEAIAETIIEDQTAKWEPKVLANVPGLAGMLLREVLALPPVQAEIAKLETAGVHWLTGEAWTALGRAKDFVLSHLSGRAQELAKQVLAPTSFHVELPEAQLIARFIEHGKLRDALAYAAERFLPSLAPVPAP